MNFDEKYDNEEPLAVFDSISSSDWRWEVYRVCGHNVKQRVDFYDGGGPFITRTRLYFGRVRSEQSDGAWEYGLFTAWELRRANTTRVDIDIPDGGEMRWP